MTHLVGHDQKLILVLNIYPAWINYHQLRPPVTASQGQIRTVVSLEVNFFWPAYLISKSSKMRMSENVATSTSTTTTTTIYVQ